MKKLILLLCLITGSITAQTNENITLDLIVKYATHCYNDSTSIINHDCPAYTGGMMHCAVYHTNYVWVHRQPTITGLIRWIKTTNK